VNTLFVIAKNTFQQAIRDKILYGIILFAFLFIGSTIILSSLAIEENIFIIRTFGLAGIYVFGLIITIFLGASLIYEEVEKRTTYIMLAKPVTRTSLLIGKFLGLLSAVALTTLMMAIAYIAVIYSSGGGIDYPAIIAVGLQIMEMALLITILMLFSIFTTPLASTIYTIIILYIGHLLSLILEYASKTGGIAKTVLITIYYLAPNLEKFNIRNLVAHNIPLSWQEVTFSLGYALIYIAFIFYITRLVFNRKDL